MPSSHKKEEPFLPLSGLSLLSEGEAYIFKYKLSHYIISPILPVSLGTSTHLCALLSLSPTPYGFHPLSLNEFYRYMYDAFCVQSRMPGLQNNIDAEDS